MTATTITDAEKTSLESLHDYLAHSDFTDSEKWVVAIDRALGRDITVCNTLGHILRPRKYRHCAGHGAQKALVAATPIGGVLKARNYAHAQTLRNTAKLLGRRVQVRQATPGSAERNVTLLT